MLRVSSPARSAGEGDRPQGGGGGGPGLETEISDCRRFREAGNARDVASPPPPLTSVDNLPGDIARSILACWHAPREGDEVTLRMSFRRDGSVFGKPRITYMRANGGLDGQADLANSIYSAIAACTPLRFTPSLGAAIAGRIFLIRFYATRKELRAAL